MLKVVHTGVLAGIMYIQCMIYNCCGLYYLTYFVNFFRGRGPKHLKETNGFRHRVGLWRDRLLFPALATLSHRDTVARCGQAQFFCFVLLYCMWLFRNHVQSVESLRLLRQIGNQGGLSVARAARRFGGLL